MPDNQPDHRESTGNLGAILGVLIAAALAIFLLNGGEHLGKPPSTATTTSRRCKRKTRGAASEGGVRGPARHVIHGTGTLAGRVVDGVRRR